MISIYQCGMRITRWMTALAAIVIVASTTPAQDNQMSQYDRGTPPQHAAGVSAIGSYMSADIGTINLSNGSLNFKLPLGSVGGRGFYLPLSLNYSSKMWSARRGTKIVTNSPEIGNPVPVTWGQYSDDPTEAHYFVAGGWTIGAAPFLKVRGVGIGSYQVSSCTNYHWVVVKLTLVLPDKGEIELRDNVKDGAPAAPGAAPSGCLTQDSGRGRIWHATDGSGIVFINDTSDGVASGLLAGKAITADGTQYHFTNPGVSNIGGSAYLNTMARCDWVQDRNGNKVLIDYPNGSKVLYTDQLGRITTVQWDDPFGTRLYDPDNAGVILAALVTLPAAGGGVHYYKIKTDVMHSHYRGSPNPISPVLPVYNGDSEFTLVGTALFTGSVDSGLDQTDSKAVLTQLILPDGRALTFSYNEYGEVAEVQLPTGGKVQYDYQSVLLDVTTGNGLPSGNSLSIEAVATGGNVRAVDRAVVARRTYPDGSSLEGQWSYTYKASSSNGIATGTTEVQCVSGTQTLLREKHYYLGAQRFLSSTSSGPDGTGYSLWSTGVERRSEATDSSGGTVITANEQYWAQRKTIQAEGKWPPPGAGSYGIEEIANDNRVTESRRYLDDGSYSNVVPSYDQTMADNNHINNPTQVDEYDLDHATLRRETKTTYDTDGHFAGTGVNTVNILTLVADQSVYDGSDLVNAKAHTGYEYDNYANDTNHQPLATYTDFSSIPGHDSSFDPTKTERGNATKVTRTVDASTSVTSYTRYDVLGNVVSIKDPKTNESSIGYVDDFGDGSNPGLNASGHSTYSLPTRLTSPAPNAGESAQTAYTQYNFSTGLLTGFKDRNGVITQTIYNDAFDRPTQIKAALGTTLENHTAMYYAPQTNPFVTLTSNDVLIAKDQASIDDRTLRSWTHTDGFGRTFESWTSDPQGNVKVATVYDGLGRAVQTSNPFRPPNETQYNTTTAYDLAGRVHTVTTADNAVVTTDYNGARVLVTDQAGKQRISQTDGLGRLTDVWEIRSTDTVTGTEPVTFPGYTGITAGYRTTYSYDALDDLLTAKQRIGTGGTLQTRTFAYDGLKRLLQAINPESGTINYMYDANSNLATKVDARSITTTYAYDALNRVTGRTYTNDPQSTLAVSYKYDNQALTGGPSFAVGSSIGRLIAVTYGAGSAGSYQGYDKLGRVNVSYQQTDSQNYGFGYGYNLASEMTSETYPSGRQVITEYDTAGRIAGVKKDATTYYAGAAASDATNRIQYAPQGAISVMKLGNGKWEHTNFNNRLQPTQIGLGTSGTDSSILELDYGYGTTSNNGNVISQTITAPGLTLNQCYGYDSLNRLSTAEERSGGTICAGTQQWKQAFIYDRYGNRTIDAQNTIPSSLVGFNTQISSSTNRIASGQNYGYDNGGNLTSDPATNANGIVYDAENRQTQYTKSQQATNYYYYDGDGHRVKKIDSTGTTVFVYNAGGQLIAEYTSGAPSGGGTSYLTSDHLGSTRVVMKSDGTTTTTTRHDYLPFGEEIQAGIGGRTAGQGYVPDNVRQKFTQKERDNESGLDYFGARYYSGPQGRFTGPDPYNIIHEAEDEDDFNEYISNPQRWNRYPYVLNNPLRYVDPDGLYEYETELLGKKLKVSISDSISRNQREQIKTKVNDAISMINKSADKLTGQQKDIIKNINQVNVSDKINRSYTIESTGTVNLVKSDVLYSASRPDHPSAGWVASALAHEGYHIELYKQSGGDLTKSRGEAAEKASNTFQRQVGEKIGLAQYEIDYLKQLEINPGPRYKEPITKPPNTQPRERPRKPTKRSP